MKPGSCLVFLSSVDMKKKIFFFFFSVGASTSLEGKGDSIILSKLFIYHHEARFLSCFSIKC